MGAAANHGSDPNLRREPAEGSKANLSADLRAFHRELAFELEATSQLGMKLAQKMSDQEIGKVIRVKLPQAHSFSFVSSDGTPVGDRLYVTKQLDVVKNESGALTIVRLFGPQDQRERLPVVILNEQGEGWSIRQQKGGYNNALLHQYSTGPIVYPVNGLDVVFLHTESPGVTTQRSNLHIKSLEFGPDYTVSKLELMDGSVVNLTSNRDSGEMISIRLPKPPKPADIIVEDDELQLEEPMPAPPTTKIAPVIHAPLTLDPKLLESRENGIELSLRTLVWEARKMAKDQTLREVLTHVLKTANDRFHKERYDFGMTDVLGDILTNRPPEDFMRVALAELCKKWAKDAFSKSPTDRKYDADYHKHVERAYQYISMWAAQASKTG